MQVIPVSRRAATTHWQLLARASGSVRTVQTRSRPRRLLSHRWNAAVERLRAYVEDD